MDGELEAVPIHTSPLPVEVVGGEVLLSSGPEGIVSLTHDAAIETGMRLIEAGLRLDRTNRRRE